MSKEDVKKNAKKNIDKLFDEIDNMEAKKDQLSETSRKKYNEKISDLKERKEHLIKKYHELENVGEDKWDEIAASFDKAGESFKKGFKEIAEIF